MAKLAAVSCPTYPRDKQKNIDKFVEWVEKAAEQDVDLVVFPEEHFSEAGTLAMGAYCADDKLYDCENAELVPEGPVTQLAVDLAKQHDMYIAFGIQEQDPDRWTITHNCCVLVGPEGYIGKYRKVHLPMDERFINVPGDRFSVFNTDLGKIGLLVCYDHCFPEASRALAVQGADIIVCPTRWPNSTQSMDNPDHIALMTLPAARALENMCIFIQAVTCSRPEGPKTFEGHSQILGPNPGQVFARIGFDEGMAVADVDVKAEIQRAKLYSMAGSDFIRDRRPGAYGTLCASNPYANFNDGFFNMEDVQGGYLE
ncbi:MAG: carbon-nitrogen hydrolase family protein [Coriobacteriales bacterium]